MKYFLLFLLFTTSLMGESIMLMWEASPPEQQVVHYKVYKKDKGNTWVLVSQTLSTEYYEYDIPYDKYEYYVTAVNVWGESIASDNIEIRYRRNSPGGVRPKWINKEKFN